MSSGFVYHDRPSQTPQFPDTQLVNVGEFNRQHQIGKPTEPDRLSELDRLRTRAKKGELW
jgi:hypothetical protein